jgi:hypothetical protein
VSLAGSATNRIAPALVAIEEAQGNAAIARGEDPARTVAPRWTAFWSAWRVWTVAQRAWADAYEAGAPGLAQAEATAKAAACALPSALPPDVPVEVVVIDGVVCVMLPGVDAGKDGGM